MVADDARTRRRTPALEIASEDYSRVDSGGVSFELPFSVAAAPEWGPTMLERAEPRALESLKTLLVKFRFSEPRFRELEPDWQMAQTDGGASRRCLIAVDDASRL